MAKGRPGIELCLIDGCAKRRVGWGYCRLHYSRLKRTGALIPSQRSQARAETIAADGTRLCFKCGERKPFNARYFPLDHRRGRGLKGTCRACLKKAIKNATLKRSYGIDLQQYLAVLAAQNGRCAICGVAFADRSKHLRPHVDHDHHSGRVRGLLCHNCNVLLGHARENSEVLRLALRYLENNHAVS